MRTGSADLPLHGGHVPRWLADRMTALGRVLAEAIVLEYGADELIRRLSSPFWFQSLGCVMGMDWHSSGITTSVLGALKRGLRPVERELGIYVCGGRGAHSRRTPDELAVVGDKTGLDAAKLARDSRMVAKVDGACVQDGFDLYLHGFFVTRGGAWTVVQQGMNGDAGLARRYHWLSRGLASFVEEPHAAIEGQPVGEIVNLVDRRARRAREAQVELVNEGPDRVMKELAKLGASAAPPRAAQSVLPFPEIPGARAASSARPSPGSRGSRGSRSSPRAPHLRMPARHHLTRRDVSLPRLHAALAAAKERGPVDFEDVLATPGVGARTLLSLAMVAEVVHGAPSRFADPARFSLAHGGKDGHPYPVPIRVYDETLRVMKKAVSSARLGQGDKLFAIRRLDEEARRLEAIARGGPSFDDLVARERRASAAYGGRTVFDGRPDERPDEAAGDGPEERPRPAPERASEGRSVVRTAKHGG
jgi:hypothetical protein